MLPSPTASTWRLSSLFSAITSAMQPARFPLALLAVLLVAALAPLVDLAAGKSFGSRGFSGNTLGASDLAMDRAQARSAAMRFAALEVAALQSGDNASESDPTPAQLIAAVRNGLAWRLEETRAAAGGGDEGWFVSEERRLRQSAASAIRTIEDSAPRGVAEVFLENERQALAKTAAAVVDLDLEGFVTGVLTAVFTVPAAAIRAAPIVFPLGLIVALSLLSICAGGLCRMAAVHAGRSARLSILEGSAFARARIVNLAVLPVLPTAVLLALGILVVLFALLLRVPVLNVLSGLLFALPLLVALLGAILVIVLLAAAPIMPAAIAVEDCDAGDAITRGCALVLGRPIAWIGTLGVAIVVLVLGTIVVSGVLALATFVIEGSLSFAGGSVGAILASGDSALIATLTGPDRLVAFFLSVWGGIFELLGAAYAFSLACDLGTRAYLLVRERLDGESPATIAGYGIG
jgi:hypothetical protein